MNRDQEYLIAALKTAMRVFPSQRVAQIIINSLPSRFNNDPYYISDSQLASLILAYCRGEKREE